jgi:hypothetical protein
VQEITLGLTRESVTVGQVIDKYGPPNALIVGSGGIPEHPYWLIILYYPKTGLQVTAYTPEGGDSLEASTEVGVAEFYAPTTLQKRVADVYGDGADADEIISSVNRGMRPWRGYGPLFGVYYNSIHDLWVEPP